MSKIKSKRPPAKRESPWIRPGIRHAKEFGFFLMEESGPPVRWQVYDCSTGSIVLHYWPATGSWRGIARLDGESGTERAFLHLFRHIRRIIEEG
jgi:hypothetical protein